MDPLSKEVIDLRHLNLTEMKKIRYLAQKMVINSEQPEFDPLDKNTAIENIREIVSALIIDPKLPYHELLERMPSVNAKLILTSILELDPFVKLSDAMGTDQIVPYATSRTGTPGGNSSTSEEGFPGTHVLDFSLFDPSYQKSTSHSDQPDFKMDKSKLLKENKEHIHKDLDLQIEVIKNMTDRLDSTVSKAVHKISLVYRNEYSTFLTQVENSLSETISMVVEEKFRLHDEKLNNIVSKIDEFHGKFDFLESKLSISERKLSKIETMLHEISAKMGTTIYK